MKKIRLGDMLVKAELLTEDQLKQALEQHKKLNMKLGEYLIQQNMIQESKLIEIISQQLRVPSYNPSQFPVDSSLSHFFSMDTAQKFKVVPLGTKGHLLIVAMVDPTDINALDAIEIEANKEVEPIICSEHDLTQLVSTIYGARNDLGEIMDDITEFEVREDSEDQEGGDVQVNSLQNMAEEAPVVRLVNSIIAQAIREKASDVHLSPEKNFVQVRFRIDGKLQEVPAPPKNLFLAIVSRLKILANMDIASTRVPQDGRFTINMDHKEVNIRVSSLPTIYGENMVLRLLDMSSGGLTLDQLGVSPLDLPKIEAVIRKPYGMILSTGPTGSGKSTSLYAILRQLNSPDINIVTLEDPVEYRIEKIRQVQLNVKAGMTFAGGLRSILRQDPDVVMVGEIRDHETAHIAIQAAMTGHRLLSTVHTNDAAGAITRFIDMGIEPFLVSSVLLCSIAQRLMRKICPYCIEDYEPDQSILNFWGLSSEQIKNATFKQGKGCMYCNNTGYKGRIGIYEVLINDEQVQQMTIARKSAQEISNTLVKQGKLRLLREDAQDKFLRGITTVEEATSAVMV